MIFYFSLDIGTPTSISFINSETGHLAASYTSETTVIFDMETKKPITTFSPTYKPFSE